MIKALANKWETSPVIPSMHASKARLTELINGKGNRTDIDMTSDDWAGVDKVSEMASASAAAWKAKVDSYKATIRSEVATGNFTKKADAVADTTIKAALDALYGDEITGAAWFTEAAFKLSDNVVVSFEDKAIEKKAESDFKFVTNANKNLDELYGQAGPYGIQDVDLSDNAVLTDKVAIVAQKAPDTALTGTTGKDSSANKLVPLYAVYAAAAHVADIDKAWLDQLNKQLADVTGKLAGELDKIASKNMLRLGGADRFETAQLIANQWAKQYGGEFRGSNLLVEAYLANGHRLADSLTAGQLEQGPIMLVKGDEKSMADLPKFTQDVARNLWCWAGTNAAPLKLYGVGGTAVLADSALQSVVDLIGTGSVCAPPEKVAAKGTPVTYSPVILDKNTDDLGGTKDANVVRSTVNTTGMTAVVENLPAGVTKDSVDNAGKITLTIGNNAAVAENGTYKVKVSWIKNGTVKYSGIIDVIIDLEASETPTVTAGTLAKDTPNAKMTAIKGTAANPATDAKVSVASVTKDGTPTGNWAAGPLVSGKPVADFTGTGLTQDGTGEAKAGDKYKVVVKVTAEGRNPVESVAHTVTAS